MYCIKIKHSCGFQTLPLNLGEILDIPFMYVLHSYKLK